MIQIVTVSNNSALYDSVIGNNACMNRHFLQVYDNSKENIGIPRRYNDFIKNKMKQDAWVVFCHQDFAFREDITAKLAKLDNNCIYGPIGTGPTKQFIFIAAFSKYGIERFRMGFYDRTRKFGQILQSTAKKTQRMGNYIRKPMLVDTVDCCCLIVHSTLVNKYNLTFDEQLDWHLYSEEFSLNAKHQYGILTKAVQLDCIHLSGGNMDAGFDIALSYVRNKHSNRRFSATCHDGYSVF